MNEADRVYAAHDMIQECPRGRLPSELAEELDALQLQLYEAAQEVEAEITYE